MLGLVSRRGVKVASITFEIVLDALIDGMLNVLFAVRRHG